LFFFVEFCNISRIRLLESNCLKNQQPEGSPHPETDETELPGGAIPNSIDPIENARVHMRGSTDLVLSIQPQSPRFFRPAVESGKDLTMSKTRKKKMGRKTTGVSKSWGPPKPWNSLMILIKLLHELLSKCYENVCWFCAGHQFEEPPTGARQ
jgi:hypothetical protein